jgi:hypothetical protein
VEFTLTEDYFATEAEALAEIAGRGWHAVTVDIAAVDNDLHWHDFDSVNFILEGSHRVELEDGSVLECGPGAKIEAPGRVVHRECSPAYRSVFGFSVAPADMTRPLNKPPAELRSAVDLPG